MELTNILQLPRDSLFQILSYIPIFESLTYGKQTTVILNLEEYREKKLAGKNVYRYWWYAIRLTCRAFLAASETVHKLDYDTGFNLARVVLSQEKGPRPASFKKLLESTKEISDSAIRDLYTSFRHLGPSVQNVECLKILQTLYKGDFCKMVASNIKPCLFTMEPKCLNYCLDLIPDDYGPKVLNSLYVFSDSSPANPCKDVSGLLTHARVEHRGIVTGLMNLLKRPIDYDMNEATESFISKYALRHHSGYISQNETVRD